NRDIRSFSVSYVIYIMILFFFFQAEDGIRDSSVTGVQTCALPISSVCRHESCGARKNARPALSKVCQPKPTDGRHDCRNDCPNRRLRYRHSTSRQCCPVYG